MNYVRMPIEIESPEQMGYDQVKYNLTESSFKDAKFGDLSLKLDDLVLCYGDHMGYLPLRKWLAKDLDPKSLLNQDHVMLTVGAASALFMVATSLLKAGDRLLVMRPNYATNIETPKAIGAQIDYYDLAFDEGYRIDSAEFISRITPATKLVSITTPHNPTGVMLSEEELVLISNACREKGAVLLVDETYREMAFKSLPPLAATLGDHVISISSLSKTYGLPGIRLGWMIHTHPKRMELFLAAKEQIFITGSLLDEVVAYQYLQDKEKHLSSNLAKMKEHLEIVKRWIQEEKYLSWVPTEGGVVCFPKIDPSVDLDRFYQTLNIKYQTFVGPGHWFEQPRQYFRLGFGWPETQELKAGLRNISMALYESLKG
jgi:aspartate/methionine/tyrosine aminotransferase